MPSSHSLPQKAIFVAACPPFKYQTALEDSLVAMSTILSSRYVGGIRSEVERVERQLSTFSDTLDQWVQVRRVGWGLTGLDDIRGLPIDLPRPWCPGN